MVTSKALQAGKIVIETSVAPSGAQESQRNMRFPGGYSGLTRVLRITWILLGPPPRIQDDRRLRKTQVHTEPLNPSGDHRRSWRQPRKITITKGHSTPSVHYKLYLSFRRYTKHTQEQHSVERSFSALSKLLMPWRLSSHVKTTMVHSGTWGLNQDDVSSVSITRIFSAKSVVN